MRKAYIKGATCIGNPNTLSSEELKKITVLTMIDLSLQTLPRGMINLRRIESYESSVEEFPDDIASIDRIEMRTKLWNPKFSFKKFPDRKILVDTSYQGSFEYKSHHDRCKITKLFLLSTGLCTDLVRELKGRYMYHDDYDYKKNSLKNIFKNNLG